MKFSHKEEPVKRWLLACVAVLFGISAAVGQPLDTPPPGIGDEPPPEGEEIGGRRPMMPGAPVHGRGRPGKMRPRMRELKDNIRAVKAELDLLTREIGEHARTLRDVLGRYMSADDEEEKAAIEKEMRGVMEKLSQYELLLAEKKVEISKKAYERALDRYVRAKVELEGATRKSKNRFKKLERGLKGEPPFGRGPSGGHEGSPVEGEPPPDI